MRTSGRDDWDDSDRREDHREYPPTASDTTGWCVDCGAECHGMDVDNGIGGYEYWGSKGTHHDYAVVSHCCEAEILDADPSEGME